jgi:class I fructose-bisphosphate aldolase
MTFVQMLLSNKIHIDEADSKNLKIDVEKNVALRPRIENMRFLEPGVEANLYRMFYTHGPGNGTALFLPFDQKSSEHGPGHEFLWENEHEGFLYNAESINTRGKGSADMRAVAELVNRGNFSGYVLHPGNVRQFKHLFRPDIPLIYKIDGHISQPRSAGFMSTVGTIEDALKYGASAIGMTIYPGGEHIKEDLERAAEIIRNAHNVGLVAVVWAYARGSGLDEEAVFENVSGITQADSLYWTHYAVSIASGLLGADIVKTKYPAMVKSNNRGTYDSYITGLAKKNSSMIAYKYLEPKDPKTVLTAEQEIFRASLVVQSAPHSIVIFSGGPKLSGDPTESLVKQTEVIMKAGAEGGIYGRNIWGLPVEDGLKTANAIKNVISETRFRRKLVERRFAGY